jgi:hypothetical protein
MRLAVWVRGVCARALLLMPLYVPSRADAAELDWRGPETCPDAEEVRFRIERAIGMPLSHAADLRFEVRAEASPRGYAARIQVDEGPGTARRERALAAVDCTRLADMVAVAVALALGADADAGSPVGTAGAAAGAGGAGEPLGSQSGADGSVNGAASSGAAQAGQGVLGKSDMATGAEATQSGADAAAPSPRSLWPALSVWFLADTGSLPQPGFGVALGGQLEAGYLQLRATATLLFGQHRELAVAANPVPGADLDLYAGALSACAVPFGSSASLAVYGCVGWELGRLSGVATGVQMPRHGAALWSTPRVDFGMSWAVSETGLRLGALLTVARPLARDDFELREFGSVHRAPSVVGRAAVGLDWALK